VELERGARALRALVCEPRCVSFVGELGAAVAATGVASSVVVSIRASRSPVCRSRGIDDLGVAGSSNHQDRRATRPRPWVMVFGVQQAVAAAERHSGPRGGGLAPRRPGLTPAAPRGRGTLERDVGVRC
jgi:hypothetical protein